MSLKTDAPLEYTGKENVNINVPSTERDSHSSKSTMSKKGLNALLQSVVTVSVLSITPREISHGSFRLTDILKYSFFTL